MFIDLIEEIVVSVITDERIKYAAKEIGDELINLATDAAVHSVRKSCDRVRNEICCDKSDRTDIVVYDF